MGVGGQRHAPAALPSAKRPGTHCIGGWVGARAGLDGCGKSRPHRDFFFRCVLFIHCVPLYPVSSCHLFLYTHNTNIHAPAGI